MQKNGVVKTDFSQKKQKLTARFLNTPLGRKNHTGSLKKWKEARDKLSGIKIVMLLNQKAPLRTAARQR